MICLGSSSSFCLWLMSIHVKLSLAYLTSYLTSPKPHVPSSSSYFQCPGDWAASSLDICLVSKLNHLCQDGFSNFAFLVLGLNVFYFENMIFFLVFDFFPCWIVAQPFLSQIRCIGLMLGFGGAEAKQTLVSWGKPTSQAAQGTLMVSKGSKLALLFRWKLVLVI